MQRTCLGFVSLVLLLSLAAPAAAENVDIPEYKMWSGWREGATATGKTEGEAEGMKMTFTTISTLKKVTAEKVTLEVVTITEFGGQKVKTPPTLVDIPAKGPKPPAAPKSKETKGKETLTVNGKRLDCEWTQVEVKGGEVTKTWTCKDVPGGVVKATTRSPTTTATSQLLVWKGEKR